MHTSSRIPCCSPQPRALGRRRRRVGLAAALALTLGIATPAAADVVEWSATPMACAPSSTTASQAQYVTTAGRIKFTPQGSGQIVFLCPVTRTLPSGRYVVAGRINLERSSQDGVIDVALRRVDKRTGAVSSLLETSAVHADSQSPPPFRRVLTQFPEEIEFDLGRFVYWVQLTLRRGSSTAPVFGVLGVELIRVD